MQSKYPNSSSGVSAWNTDSIISKINAKHAAEVAAADAKRDRLMAAAAVVRELLASPEDATATAKEPSKVPRGKRLPAGNTLIDKIRAAVLTFGATFSGNEIAARFPEAKALTVKICLRQLAEEGVIRMVSPGRPGRGGHSAVYAVNLPTLEPRRDNHEAKPRYADSDPAPLNAMVIGAGARIGRPEEP